MLWCEAAWDSKSKNLESFAKVSLHLTQFLTLLQRYFVGSQAGVDPEYDLLNLLEHIPHTDLQRDVLLQVRAFCKG